MKDVNVVVLVCRLTRDPELRSTPGGTSVCNLRVAFSSSWKDGDEWKEKPNYADVTVWGAQGESCSRYLSKGRQICVFGRLQWRQFTDKENHKRQALDIVADQVQFLGGGEQGGGSSGGSSPASDVSGDFQPAPVGAAGQDEDIPFLWRPVEWDDRFHPNR